MGDEMGSNLQFAINHLKLVTTTLDISKCMLKNLVKQQKVTAETDV